MTHLTPAMGQLVTTLGGTEGESILSSGEGPGIDLIL